MIADYRRGATSVDDEHMLDFLLGAGPRRRLSSSFRPEPERPAFFDWHRQRSIHVHCWSQDEFWPVVGFGIEALGHRWEHVDGFRTGDPAADGIEFGLALGKDTVSLPPAVRVQRWYAAIGVWNAAQPPDVSAQLADAQRDAAALRASTSWRVTAPLRLASDKARAVRSRLRQH